MAVDTTLKKLYLFNSKLELLSLAYEVSSLGTHFIGFHFKLATMSISSSESVSLHFDNITTNCLFISTQEGMFIIDPRDRSPAVVQVTGITTSSQRVSAKWNGELLAYYTMESLSVYRINRQAYEREGVVRFTKIQTLS